MKKVETTLTFAELTKLAPADLFKRAAIAVKISKAVESAKDKFTETLQFSAKVVAAMKRRYQAHRFASHAKSSGHPLFDPATD